jgi:DNA-binding XRE family transcriptional regulator
MPVSVRRHNLQRLREELLLTQSALAGWIGRSAATIKAVEIGKLALSDNLASLIASITGANKEWLLRNDLSEPMAPLEHTSAKLSPEQEAYDSSIVLLYHLFDRLFAAARRLKPTQARRILVFFIKKHLEFLEQNEQQPDAEYDFDCSRSAFEFFRAHPELLDVDLASLINLDYIIKDAYRREKVEETYGRKIRCEGKEAKQWLNEHFSELSPEEQVRLASLKPRRRKERSPSRKSS